MREYELKRGTGKNLEGDSLRKIAAEVFGDVGTDGAKVIVSHGALEKMVVWTDGKKLFVDTTMKSGVPDHVATDTIKAYNAFLERATGLTAKERGKRAQQAAKKALPDDRSRSASRKWKRVRAVLGLAEERTQARSRLFLGDLLFFLLLLFLLLFLLLGGRRCRGSGGRHRDGGLQGLVDVHAFQRGGQSLHAGLVDLHPGRGEDLLQVLLAHGLAGRMQDQRPVHIFHSSSPPCCLIIRSSCEAPRRRHRARGRRGRRGRASECGLSPRET